jgi:hypothetical protein
MPTKIVPLVTAETVRVVVDIEPTKVAAFGKVYPKTLLTYNCALTLKNE